MNGFGSNQLQGATIHLCGFSEFFVERSSHLGVFGKCLQQFIMLDLFYKELEGNGVCVFCCDQFFVYSTIVLLHILFSPFFPSSQLLWTLLGTILRHVMWFPCSMTEECIINTYNIYIYIQERFEPRFTGVGCCICDVCCLMWHITTWGGGTCGKRSAVDYSAKGSHVMVWFRLLKLRLWSYELLPTRDNLYIINYIEVPHLLFPHENTDPIVIVDFGKKSELFHCDQTPQVAWYSGQRGAKWNALTQRI